MIQIINRLAKALAFSLAAITALFGLLFGVGIEDIGAHPGGLSILPL